MKELNSYQKLIIDTLLTEKQNKINAALKSIGFPNDMSKFNPKTFDSLIVDLSEIIKIRELLNIPRAKI
jgi:hypothetical protein